jgi:RNA-directed DNA polymerase
VQAAAKLVLEPIFEADLDPSAYGYRPKRGGLDAIKEVHALICRGYTDVVDADLAKYFETIPHRELMQSVARRILDRNVLRLIKLWLKTPIEERDEDGKRRMSGGKSSTCGTPEDSVISPTLANIYMNRFLKYWRGSGRNGTYQAHVVSYADDFVILSRGHAEEALAWTRRVMTRLGLALNEAKTSIRNARQERFEFLGYAFGPHHYRKDGHWYLGASPSKKSVLRLKQRVGAILVPGNQAPWAEVRSQLNSLLRGWSAYFGYGTRLIAYRAVDHHVYHSVRRFLVRPHKVQSQGTRRFSDEVVFGERGVLRLRHVHIGAPPTGAR